MALGGRQEIFSEYLQPEEHLPEWCTVISVQDFDAAYWGREREVTGLKYMPKELMTDHYHPSLSYWTIHNDNYIFGVSAFQKKNVEKDFPPHVLNRRHGGGDALAIRASRPDDFMRRDGRKWD